MKRNSDEKGMWQLMSKKTKFRSKEKNKPKQKRKASDRPWRLLDRKLGMVQDAEYSTKANAAKGAKRRGIEYPYFFHVESEKRFRAKRNSKTGLWDAY